MTETSALRRSTKTDELYEANSFLKENTTLRWSHRWGNICGYDLVFIHFTEIVPLGLLGRI